VVDEAAEWTRRAREQEDPEKIAAAKAFIAEYEAAKSAPQATEVFINKHVPPQTAAGRKKAIIIVTVLVVQVWRSYL
jgi:hypothetical protein